MRLWLIDAGYLFSMQKSIERGYQFDYLKLRRKLEESGSMWRCSVCRCVPGPLLMSSWARTELHHEMKVA